MRSILKGFVTLSLVGAAFVGGFRGEQLLSSRGRPEILAREAQVGPAVLLGRLESLTRPAPAGAQGTPELAPFETFSSVLATIRRDYEKPTDAKGASRLKYAAIKGMLASIGDRYTEYWTPEEYTRNMEDTRGQFGGIGASLDVNKNKEVLIVEPLEKSPAERAGIKPGDVITLVDGKPTFTKPTDTLDDVIKRIRGELGTGVTLTLRREGTPKPITVKIIRDIVSSPVITQYLLDNENKIGYIRLDQFTEEAAHQFDRSFTRLQAQGAKALIFDLRSNPGGLLPVSIQMVSRFVESGPAVWIKEKSGELRHDDVEPRLNSPLRSGKIPVVVLVNGASASASEITAGALQDSGTGFLVGTRTFGKGLVQTIYPLSDGEGAVKITTQHYFTRDKHDINMKRDESGAPIGGSGGIKPDLVIAQTEKDIDAQRAALRENPRDRAGAFKFDPQVQKSLALLRDRLAGKPFPESEKSKPDAPKTTTSSGDDIDGDE
jgi:carboxyl-terminal processing protease